MYFDFTRLSTSRSLWNIEIFNILVFCFSVFRCLNRLSRLSVSFHERVKHYSLSLEFKPTGGLQNSLKEIINCVYVVRNVGDHMSAVAREFDADPA